MPQPIHLLIPAYDEAENLPKLLEGLIPVLEGLKRPWEILFVDDGSTDATVSLLKAWSKKYPVRVQSHRKNLGPGAAFVSGFRNLLTTAADEDAIVTLEADGTSDIRLLPEMLERFDRGADLVLASVYHPKGGLLNTPAYRRVLSLGANAILRALFEMPGIYTFSSFYRVYRTGVLREAMDIYGLRLIEEPGFAAVVELLIRLHRLGIKIGEVPMVLDSARRKGASRMRIGHTVRAYVRMMIRQRLELTPIEQLIQEIR